MPLHRDNAHPRNLNLPPVLFALTELCIFDIDDIDVTYIFLVVFVSFDVLWCSMS